MSEKKVKHARRLKFASVCTGIGAPEVAWKKLGWEPQWFSEIEPFPCRVLAHHYPTVPNLGDMTQLETNETFLRSTFDVLVGGTPCQSFSLAGLRGGMADSRGNLALVFCRLLVAKRPPWFVWENVPGVFSSFSDEAGSEAYHYREGDAATVDGIDITQTADFATLLTAFRECGYSVCWRILDSQYFGVPQRRRRVFVVGHLGNDWRPPFAVLFERDSLRRDFTPRRAEREAVAGTLSARPTGGGFPGTDESLSGYVQPMADTLHAGYGDKSDRGEGKNLICMAHGQGGAEINIDLAPTLTCNHEAPIVSGQPIAFDNAQITNPTNRSRPNVNINQTLTKAGSPMVVQPYTLHGTDGTASIASETETHSALRARAPGMVENSTTTVVMQPIAFTARDYGNDASENIAPTMRSLAKGADGHQSGSHGLAFAYAAMVRRLTPMECERLQGFPDGYTDIPKAADGPRYKSMGNSMTTYVLEWIGCRIGWVSELLKHVGHV